MKVKVDMASLRKHMLLADLDQHASAQPRVGVPWGVRKGRKWSLHQGEVSDCSDAEVLLENPSIAL